MRTNQGGYLNYNCSSLDCLLRSVGSNPPQSLPYPKILPEFQKRGWVCQEPPCDLGPRPACRTQEPGGWEDSARPLGIEKGFQATRPGICGGSDSVNPEFKEYPVNIWVAHTQCLSCGWYSIYKNSFVCYLLWDNTVCNCYFVIPGSLLH